MICKNLVQQSDVHTLWPFHVPVQMMCTTLFQTAFQTVLPVWLWHKQQDHSSFWLCHATAETECCNMAMANELLQLMLNSKEWLICSKPLELFLMPVLWKQKECFLLFVLTALPVRHQVGKHWIYYNLWHLSLWGWIFCQWSTCQCWGWSALHTSVVESGLCPHARCILCCWLDFDCFRIAVLSLAHKAQLLVAKVLATSALMGLPWQLHCLTVVCHSHHNHETCSFSDLIREP